MPKTRVKTTTTSRIKPYTTTKRKSNIMSTAFEIDTDTEDALLQSDNESKKKKIDPMAAIGDMKKLLMNIHKNQCTKTDMQSFVSKVEYRLDNIDVKIAGQEKNIVALKERLDKCEGSADSVIYRVELDKQRQIKNNLSIFGIPFVDGERLGDMVSLVFDKIECNMCQFTDCYRVKGNAKGIIIVKLTDFDAKQRILAAKSKKPLKLGDLIACSSENAKTPIFINNHTTPFFGKLLQEGRKEAKNEKIHSCWLNSFGCQVKFTDRGKQYGFTSVEELRRLIDEHGGTVAKKSSKRSSSHLDLSSSDNTNSSKKVQNVQNNG